MGLHLYSMCMRLATLLWLGLHLLGFCSDDWASVLASAEPESCPADLLGPGLILFLPVLLIPIYYNCVSQCLSRTIKVGIQYDKLVAKGRTEKSNGAK